MQKIKRPKARSTRDSYLDLIRRFPLKTIKNDNEHAQASRMISNLIGHSLDPGAAAYLDTLIVLVNKYEDEHHELDELATPQENLRALMKFNDLTQADIGRLVGSEPSVSMFLKGHRELSKSQIKKLANHFKVNATLFLK